MITFTGVSLIYPNSLHTVLEDLTFSVDEGELILVTGSTGIGKSSLLRLINGLVPHHTGGILAGDISVNGISTRTVKPGGLAHLVGIVGQNPLQGFVTDTVEEELAFGMEALNLSPEIMRKRVEETLDLLSLAPLRNRNISTLSGGEQQRVAIGSALVMHPKVLVLDEPTSALDPIAAEEVLSILHRLVHDLALTIVIAEHKLERVIQFADRILHIQSDGSTSIGLPQKILETSDLAPPIVHLARALKMPEIALTVREMRRMTEPLRSSIIKKTRSTTESKTAKPILQTHGIKVNYGQNRVLNNVSADFYPGEIVAIMGRNGAGKSTLLKTLVGITSPDAGKVQVLERNPFELVGRDRTSLIGFIPQEPSDLLYEQSVAQECQSADKDNGVLEGTTFSLLTQLVPGISPITHPRDLSEGQRLSLAVSVVLSAQPMVLILDEPTRGLDYSAKASLISIIRQICQKENRLVIIATHDVELVGEVATRTIFLSEGEIVADGPTVEVLLSSPAFAPQIAKIMAPAPWLTVKDVLQGIAKSP